MRAPNDLPLILLDCSFPGTFTNKVGQTACQSCPADSTSLAGSDEVFDCVCKAGFEGPAGGLCLLCPLGKYKAEAGSSAPRAVNRSMVALSSGCQETSHDLLHWRLGSCLSAEWNGRLEFEPGRLSILFYSDEADTRDQSDKITIFVHGVQAVVLVNTGCTFTDVNACESFLDWPGPGDLRIVQNSSKNDYHFHAAIQSIVYFGSGCTSCPVGTYSSYWQNAPGEVATSCRSCPSNSNTSGPGSTIDECVCDRPWYEQYFGGKVGNRTLATSPEVGFISSRYKAISGPYDVLWFGDWEKGQNVWFAMPQVGFPSTVQPAKLFAIGGSTAGVWAGIRYVAGIAVFRARARRTNPLPSYAPGGKLHSQVIYADVTDFPQDDRNHSVLIGLTVTQLLQPHTFAHNDGEARRWCGLEHATTAGCPLVHVDVDVLFFFRALKCRLKGDAAL